MQQNALPLYFLKIIDFDEESNELALQEGNVSSSH